jgi:MarR family transcriptional regulator, lower aerobic nicotinate degradation pathway regulator
MRNKDIVQIIDLLSRFPRIMRVSLQREIIKPPLKLLDKNLAPHHLIIMKIIDEEGSLHISEIGLIAKISKAQMTHSIDKLAQLGMINRTPDPQDRRKISITLTEKGKETVTKLDRVIEKRMKESLSWLQDEEVIKVLDALKYLIITFEKLGR